MVKYEEPKLQNCNFEWCISNFKVRPCPITKITSPEYTIKTWFTTKWAMVLNFRKNLDHEIYLSLTLKRCAVDEKVGQLQVQCKLQLDLNPYLTIEKEHLFEEVCDLSFDDFSTLDGVLDSEDAILRDRIYINVQIVVKEPKQLTQGCIDKDLIPLSSELQYIYEKQICPDMVIEADSKKFKVHKNIFEARCKYHRNFIENGTVDVSHVKTKVLEKLIYFMYTGDMYSFLKDPVLGLAHLAEDFGILDLAKISKPDQIFLQTTFVSETCKFSWSIENFSEHVKKMNPRLMSPILNIGKQRVLWHLRISFHKDYLSLFAEVISRRTDFIVCFEASVLNSKNKNSFVKETSVLNHRLCGFPSFVDLKYLKESGDLITDDTLRLRCILKFSFGAVVETTTVNESYMSTVAECNSYKTLYDDILSIYKQGESDMIVLVGDEQFALHKCILVARSSVFRRLIQVNEVDPIILTEIESDVFEIMVRYMYSEKLNKIELNMALQIYPWAKYFGMPSLAKASSAVLLSYMSPDCICSLLKLAHEYLDIEFKNAVIRFICFNAGEVLHREEWKILKKEYLSLNDEVMSMIDRMTAQFGNLEDAVECVEEVVG